MILKDEEQNTQSETKPNLEIMQRYIRKHFARTREKWEIKCIPEETWANLDKEEGKQKIDEEHKEKHRSSKIQDFARRSRENAEHIKQLGEEITEHEISKAISKLNNRKSVGQDEIAAETIKENKIWLIPILKKNV